MAINFSELEDQFAAKPAAGLSAAGGRSQPAARAVLDLDRARNVGVFLRGLRLALPAVVEALEAVCSDESALEGGQRVLSDDELAGLLALWPAPAEAAKLRACGCA